MVKQGILYFHQGWTDIINCLGLINYYCNRYDKIYLIVREGASKMIEFYTTDLKNIEIFYETIDILNGMNAFPYFINKYEHLRLNPPDLLGIGQHDHYRADGYANKFSMTYNNTVSFVEAFYISYNIPYSTRINDFTFTRNHELEQTTYQNFLKKYGNDYILYHEVIQDYHEIVRKYGEPKKIINLNGISDTFFDMIIVLENALEIHLLDSVWAAFIYQLDAKYRLFKNKKITLYAKRGYKLMFTRPVQLDNWIIIE
jgi:hypothetical protein